MARRRACLRRTLAPSRTAARRELSARASISRAAVRKRRPTHGRNANSRARACSSARRCAVTLTSNISEVFAGARALLTSRVDDVRECRRGPTSARRRRSLPPGPGTGGHRAIGTGRARDVNGSRGRDAPRVPNRRPPHPVEPVPPVNRPVPPGAPQTPRCLDDSSIIRTCDAPCGLSFSTSPSAALPGGRVSSRPCVVPPPRRPISTVGECRHGSTGFQGGGSPLVEELGAQVSLRATPPPPDPFGLARMRRLDDARGDGSRRRELHRPVER